MSDTSNDDLLEAMDNLSVTSDESDETDVVRQKPIDKAYQEIQKELGKDIMTFQDYEYYYFRFYNGKLDLEYDRSLDPKMKDAVGLIVDRSEYKEHRVISEKIQSLRNNPIAIRACILSDVVRQKPIDKAYQEFQKELGADIMTFQDYEYYYYRFYNGELDLDHERNLDPKMKEFSDLPVDVVGSIIERSEYKEQLILRKTSKSLRSLVDEQKPACNRISVFQPGKEICINFTNQSVMYAAESEEDDGVNEVVRDDFEKVAFDDLASTLKNPKLQLEEFNVNYNILKKENIEKFHKNIQNVMQSLNHQLSVEKCSMKISNPSQFLSILPHLKPGILKKLTLWLDNSGFDWSGDSAEMDQVASLEQWKQVEELKLNDAFDRFPMKYATHFKRFQIFEEDVDGDKFLLVINYLSKLDRFEHCDFGHSSFFAPFDFGAFLKALNFSSNDSKTSHYAIPDSNYHLEFKTSPGSICVQINRKINS